MNLWLICKICGDCTQRFTYFLLLFFLTVRCLMFYLIDICALKSNKLQWEMIISGFYQLINELDQNEGKRRTLDNYFVLQHRVYIPFYYQILVYSQIYKWQSVVDI